MGRFPFLIPLGALTAGILLAEAGAGWVTAVLELLLSLTLWGAMKLAAGSLSKRGRGGAGGSGNGGSDQASAEAAIREFHAQKLRQPAIFAFFLAVGIGAFLFSKPKIPDFSGDDAPEFVEMRVTRVRPTTYGDLIDGQLLGYRGIGVRITLTGILLQPGDVIRFRQNLTPVSANKNYFKNDFTRTLNRKGIYLSQTLNPHDCELKGVSHTLSTRASLIRYRLSELLEKSWLTRESSTLLRTVLLGDSESLPGDDRAQFAASGLAHLLSLSGLHTGLVAALILFLFKPLNLTRNGRVRYPMAIICVWLFVVLTGLHVPAIRAAVMLSFYMMTLFFERTKQPLNSLFAACFFILLFDPTALYDCGFQLSVVCVFSLVAFTSLILDDRYRRYPMFYNSASAVLTTLLATFGSWAIVAYHFSQLPLMFLPANLLAAPLMPFFMGSGAIVLLFEILGLHPHFFAEFVNKMTVIFYNITDYFGNERFVYTDINVSAWTAILWTATIALLFIAISLRNNKKRFYTLSALTSAAFISSIALLIFTPKKNPQNGFIIHQNYKELSFTTLENDNENVIVLNIKSPIDTVISSKKISYINDRRYYKKCKTRQEIPDVKQAPEFLIIGPDFYGSPEDVLQYFTPKNIIGHKSLKADIDISFETYCKQAGIPYHSIKQSGPYRELSEE